MALDYFKVDHPESHSTENKYPWIHPPVPKPSERLMIIGASGCGKTHVGKCLLRKWWLDEEGQSLFDIIVIFSPSLLHDPIYEELYANPILHDKIDPHIEMDIKLIQKLLDRKPDNLKICVMIDDFAFDKKVFQQPEVIALYTRGRHANITPVILSQFLTAISPIIRENSTGYIVFPLTRPKEEILLREQISTPRIKGQDFDDVLKEAHKGSEHNFLYFHVPTRRYYQNFEYELNPPEGEEPVRLPQTQDSTATATLKEQRIMIFAPQKSIESKDQDEIDKAIEEEIKALEAKISKQ